MKLGLVEPLALDERRDGDADGPLGGAHSGVSGRTIQGQQDAIRSALPPHSFLIPGSQATGKARRLTLLISSGPTQTRP
jgi:hypothetical protein